MKIGVLTSSRADYGIYLPLLKKIKKDSFFSLEIIAFGTHLSKFHGYTINNIIEDDYAKHHKISSLITNDNEQDISTSYALTALKFADFWSQNKFDLIICLGDRFEMNAAVQSGIPFGLKFAHIHGGETTLGAIDNIYRHQITLASIIHFTATKENANKVAKLIGDNKNIYTVGALSLDEINDYTPIEKNLFYKKFNLKNKPYVLVTFHPETISVSKNKEYAKEMRKSLVIIAKKINIVITMPNADTVGSVFREEIYELKKNKPEEVTLIENFGKINYFSAMWYASFLIGNTSSGIIEAASFNKFVLNVGDRQKGRTQSDNVIDVAFNKKQIISKTNSILEKGKYQGSNEYFKGNASLNILNKIKEFYEKL
ncbi:UDP-N-acetylglucosamine 2-epimerase (hydrolyzing) [Cellulophaga baltica]|uniref:UDP-N-acetylglucosamine 2-epimerase n=1 Tax=Cellulophaga TaxID=104264 RepID=UPI001C06D4D5|nr:MULTISPECIES: UDP-N-acetylglucosamine 2-epimerase [Cellulophaga]MBU2995978.1 UDP-N-acetylglucosamine 2-epimerase (hydrolyzing) [Cellulophaga baltica]MDO6767373.1 UDP-N-acetylglucosamine 2-epimerase [Cellulophaga sp. 1_MG-2023]